MRVWLVLRVERREIRRQGGHFHSCTAMLNTSLPLEQLPYPKQLYGRVGSAQVKSDVGQLPGIGVTSELWMAAECPVGAGAGLQGQSLIPHLGHNYLCSWMSATVTSHWCRGDVKRPQHSMDIINVTFRIVLIHGYIYFLQKYRDQCLVNKIDAFCSLIYVCPQCRGGHLCQCCFLLCKQ